MKCSNELSCQGNDNDYYFKGMFFHFFNGFVFLSELDKPNEFEKSWARMTVLFVLARRLNLMHRKGWMYVLVMSHAECVQSLILSRCKFLC